MVLFNNFFDILFPRICGGCNSVLNMGEKHICTECLCQLPLTGYWKENDNPVAKMFWGRIYLQNASSFLHFQKGGRLQGIIHNMKYKNQKEIGFFLGEMLGKELINTSYSSVDLIVPVPLHKSKIRKRGYNQSDYIAGGLSEVLGIPVETEVVKRIISSDSQTKKSRYERWENVMNIFNVEKPNVIEGKHILLVDDVLTTGATIEACATVLQGIPGVKVSAVTLAYAMV